MKVSFQSAVGARIRSLREATGMSQRDFAAAARFNATFAGRVERGLQNLTLVAIARVALALDVPVEALFSGIAPGPEVLEVKPRRKLRRKAAAAEAEGSVPGPPPPRRRRASKPKTGGGVEAAPDVDG